MSRTVFQPFFALVLIFGQFHVPAASPPPNDQFVDAAAIPALPFSTTIELSDATIETEEPQYCEVLSRSVWFALQPTATLNLRAYAQDGVSGTVNIYQSTGPGVTGLQHIDCATPSSPVSFVVEAGQTYYFQAGSGSTETSSMHFSLSEVASITGQVTDALTGAPLPGDAPPFSQVTLYRACGEGCQELVTMQSADGQGVFVLDSYFGDALPAGMYQIEAAASMYDTQLFAPFAFNGVSLDVGDLPLQREAALGSITGRLLDHATGKPVPSLFEPVVQLFHSTDGTSFELISTQIPDSQGSYRFETDSLGNPLPTGTYQVLAFAEQYQEQGASSRVLEVGEGLHRKVGDLRIRSLPVRFSDIEPCADLPPAGGECLYSVRVWNGLPAEFEGNVWSLASSSLPASLVSFTEFQTREPQKVELERGRSKVFRFRIRVPASGSPSDPSVCTRMFVGRGGNSFFNTVGYRDLFCVSRTDTGFAAESAQDAARQAQAPAGTAGIESEPNNSCQEAQEVGAAALPFVMHGNLESSTTPDVDFFRFSGTPGAPIMIDHEGLATGAGTLFDPLLGVFDSGCSLYTSNDDSLTLNARVVTTIPADGVFILAASAFPDDQFVGGGNGTYRVTVTPIHPIGSISGRVSNTAGVPLRGDAPPFATVYLQQCTEFGCFDVSEQAAGSDGSFSFTTDNNGIPLGAGTYTVIAVADQYQSAQAERFPVNAGENADAGTLPLTPFPVQFSAAQGCTIDSDGGTCEFSVRVTNTLPTRVAGKAWSIIHGPEIGSPVNFTTFQTDTPISVTLDPGKSRGLRFRFRVRGAVPDGTIICPTVYMGQNPEALFTPVGRSFLFCLVKGGAGFDLMSPEASNAALQQMDVPEEDSSPLFDRKQN